MDKISVDENYKKYILERFLSVKWSDSERQDILNGPRNKLPYLPLDVKIDDASLKAIVEEIEKIHNSKFFYYCESRKIHTTLPEWGPFQEKFVFYGPKTEQYKDFWYRSRDDGSVDQFEKETDWSDYKWRMEIPELKNFVDSLPLKKLYVVESRNSRADGREFVHTDREKMYKGLHNRIYLPLTWPKGCEFRFTGLGDVLVEPGRPIMLNGNHYHHGTINRSGKRRLAIIISANVFCKEFDSLLDRSYKKFVGKM